jgi:hypothetical protein
MIPEAVKARIHQVVPLYLLYNLGFVVYSESSNGVTSKTVFLPVGTPISIINMLIAGKANATFFEDIKKYSLIDKFISPGETIYGILCINSYANEQIRFVLNNDKCANTVDLNPQPPVLKYDVLSNGIYYQASDISYDNYIERMEDFLKLDEGVIDFSFVEKKYKNGNIKTRGYEARHKYGVNTNYRYDIGTWEYFHENGQLQKRVHKDWREFPVKTEEF